MTAVRRWAFGLGFVGATLAACNAIVGVDDVTLRNTTARPKSDASLCESEDCDASTASPDGGAPNAEDRGSLALGAIHTCARMPNRTVRCWGDNGAGQIGSGLSLDGSQPSVLKPQIVPGIKDAIAIASGLNHTCIVHEAGDVSCWGLNLFGQLGDGTKNTSSKPVKVLGLHGATALAGGTSFTCALRKDKTVACWGANYSGQLGDGTKVDERPSVGPVKALGGVASIAAASDHACAVLESGGVMCWGRNTEGQLGIGSTTESLVPVKLTALSNIVQVAAAARFSCALEQGGRIYCWGANDYGQLGNGSPNATPNPSPNLVPSISDATFVWAGFEHACAVRRSGAMACWGSASAGQLGLGAIPSDASIATPVAVVGGAMALAVWTGGSRSCSMATDGRAFCWGSNSQGQLGDGTTNSAYGPVRVSGIP